MGFEHKIYFRLTDTDRDAIQKLITGHDNFSKAITVDNNKLFEFRGDRASNDMPDLSITIENDGLYICNNISSKPDANIDFIIQYLKDNGRDYHIDEL